MSDRIVVDVIDISRRIWGFIPVSRPQPAWRVVSIFTGEPEPQWYQTREAAEEALIESRKSEAAILAKIADILSETRQYEHLDAAQRIELIDLARANDGGGFRKSVLHILGEERGPRLMNSLAREKVFEDTHAAVLGRQSERDDGGGGEGPSPPHGPTGREREAFEYGERVSQQLTARIDSCLADRYGVVSNNFLEVLRERLGDCIVQSEAPAIYVGLADFNAFRENVDALRSKFLAEIEEDMKEWYEVLEPDIQALLARYTEKRISDLLDQLTTDGQQVFLDHCAPLMDADRTWRMANPEKAKDWPEIDFPPSEVGSTAPNHP